MRARQDVAFGEPVVETLASDADHPERTNRRVVRENEAETRLNDVRRGVQEHFPFGQRVADHAELILLQVAQAAMQGCSTPKTSRLRGLRARRARPTARDRRHRATPTPLIPPPITSRS
ncbi:MAG: hypothetical protein R2849_18620 [Thermomicrobiales bacterium]